MGTMQFKSFSWPNDPETYTLSGERRTAVQKIPLGAFVVQDLGRTCMVLRGEGEFFGPGAYESYRALLAVFQEEGAGMLVHPAWMCASALFTRLQLTQEPREDYVAYSFEFCEATAQEPETTKQGGAAEGQVRYHLVTGGETLWSLCTLYGVTMGQLTGWNPLVARPDGLQTGQKVRVG